ncbi:MAG: hypothetical protein QOJ99_3856, partial [Bryobacterales bacterium]|nr:hypothetical protein [Bryobacterales bacterium]
MAGLCSLLRRPNAIARLLNERQMATQTGKGRFGSDPQFEACCAIPRIAGLHSYGKTERRLRQRVT